MRPTSVDGPQALGAEADPDHAAGAPQSAAEGLPNGPHARIVITIASLEFFLIGRGRP